MPYLCALCKKSIKRGQYEIGLGEMDFLLELHSGNMHPFYAGQKLHKKCWDKYQKEELRKGGDLARWLATH